MVNVETSTVLLVPLATTDPEGSLLPSSVSIVTVMFPVGVPAFLSNRTIFDIPVKGSTVVIC